MKNLFIPIGHLLINFAFDKEGNLVKSVRCKFLMLELAGELKMLLMVEGSPFTYHAEALLDYMKENNLSAIKVNGGGKISFSFEDKLIIAEGKSYAFGKSYDKEVTSFLKKIFPEFEINARHLDVDCNVGEMNVAGKIFSFEKVKHFADNP